LLQRVVRNHVASKCIKNRTGFLELALSASNFPDV